MVNDEGYGTCEVCGVHETVYANRIIGANSYLILCNYCSKVNDRLITIMEDGDDSIRHPLV